VAEASYFLALEGVTKYGLSTAVKAILQNALGHAFFPSPPELRGQCDKAMQPHKEARERAYRRDRDKYPCEGRRERPLTDDERARAAALMAELNKRFERQKDEAMEAERAEIRARYGMTPDVLATIRDRPADPISKPAE
jgi:hypothetical protein